MEYIERMTKTHDRTGKENNRKIKKRHCRMVIYKVKRLDWGKKKNNGLKHFK